MSRVSFRRILDWKLKSILFKPFYLTVVFFFFQNFFFDGRFAKFFCLSESAVRKLQARHAIAGWDMADDLGDEWWTQGDNSGRKQVHYVKLQTT